MHPHNISVSDRVPHMSSPGSYVRIRWNSTSAIIPFPQVTYPHCLRGGTLGSTVGTFTDVDVHVGSTVLLVNSINTYCPVASGIYVLPELCSQGKRTEIPMGAASTRTEDYSRGAFSSFESLVALECPPVRI